MWPRTYLPTIDAALGAPALRHGEGDHFELDKHKRAFSERQL
jgi:hypothetical protein